ncbi:hypothetical protein, partial [Pararhodobacter sp. SW119]|uniref:hypothetical protein n=1 Tax=Pararhodobacter sp. SW119 TaxID=2780075 RepID=UPI001FD825E5
MRISEDGKVEFTDAQREPLSQAKVRRLREADPEAINRALEQAVAAINADLDACLGVHLSTPCPRFVPLPPPVPPGREPHAPIAREIGFWDRLLFRRAGIERANALDTEHYKVRLSEWRGRVREHAAESARLETLNARLREGMQDVMEEILANRLQDIAWAKETHVAFDFGDDSGTLALDLDLPTIDEMPHRTAAMPARGHNLRMSKRGEAQRRRDFIRLVTGSCFRVAGEAFACLPTVSEMTVSGFTQRIDPATGMKGDVYVISVRI